MHVHVHVQVKKNLNPRYSGPHQEHVGTCSAVQVLHCTVHTYRYLFVLNQVSDVVSPQCQLVSETLEGETKPVSIKQTSADPSHRLKHFDEQNQVSIKRLHLRLSEWNLNICPT